MPAVGFEATVQIALARPGITRACVEPARPQPVGIDIAEGSLAESCITWAVRANQHASSTRVLRLWSGKGVTRRHLLPNLQPFMSSLQATPRVPSQAGQVSVCCLHASNPTASVLCLSSPTLTPLTPTSRLPISCFTSYPTRQTTPPSPDPAVQSPLPQLRAAAVPAQH